VEVFNGLKWFSLVVEGFSAQKIDVLIVEIYWFLFCFVYIFLLCLANLFGVSIQFACTKRDDEIFCGLLFILIDSFFTQQVILLRKKESIYSLV